jgi:hypothetical protein
MQESENYYNNVKFESEGDIIADEQKEEYHKYDNYEQNA